MFRERNPFVVVLLSVFTFGIYFIYWFYDTNVQFRDELEDGSHPILRTLVLFLPPLSFVSYYKHARSCERATDGHDWLLVFLAYVFFIPIALFAVQDSINDSAGE
jgi:hypothetical protein